jgi:hypothetical protein
MKHKLLVSAGLVVHLAAQAISFGVMELRPIAVTRKNVD